MVVETLLPIVELDLLVLQLPFEALLCFDDAEVEAAEEWCIIELCLYDLGLGFDCLVYPAPPPPLGVERVEECPGECCDDIPPGPGPGGEETFVIGLLL